MADVNLILFSQRLKRLLAGEEGTLLLPDSTNLKPYFQNILTEIEIITSLLGNYEGDVALILLNESCRKEHVDDGQDIKGIVKDINYFINELEKAIDTFFISSETTSSKELCDALVHLQSKINGVRNRMQQLPTSQINAYLVNLRDFLIQTEASDSSSSSSSGFEKKPMEELLDLLIEGKPQLSVVAILDSSGFDKTAFAAEAYNSNHAKYYFDCRIWVKMPIVFNFNTIIDTIMKCVMPPSEFSEIMGKDLDYALKQTVLHDYLKNKKYLIVFDDVFEDFIWDPLREDLPDSQNGSRVLMTVTNLKALTHLLDREEIPLYSGPLIRITNDERPCFLLYYGSGSLEAQEEEMLYRPISRVIISVLELPFYLKACCLYLCGLIDHHEICTRQLYELWIAEGLIPNNREETAEEYLKELICRGLIKAEKRRAGGTIITCSVTSIVFAALSHMSETLHFVLVSKVNLVKGCTAKRISMGMNLTEFVSMEHSNKYLHSWLNFISESDHPDCMEIICKKFKYLRVLNLGSLVLDQYPSGIENLSYLKYLKLNIPSLKRLPSSLCNLLNLYTLNMPSSYIDHTPDDIWKMDKLMHLNFGYIILPPHPGNYCSSLKNLRFLSTLHSRSCTADILAKLPNVQTLRIFGDLSYYQSEMSKSLCELLKLEHLKLVNEDKTWHISQMVLAEYRFPPSLTHLSLSNTKLGDDPMPALEKLPHLQVLKLKQNSYFGRKLACAGSGSFLQLKILHLKSMPWLEEWTVGVGALPKLESLIINPCSYLRNLPEELWRINSFRKLDLHWPQTELRKSLRVFEDMERYEIQKYPYGI